MEKSVYQKVGLLLCSVGCLWACAGDLRAVEEAPVAAPLEIPADLKVTLFDRVLKLNQIQEPELNLKAAKEKFEALVDKVAVGLMRAKKPREKIAVLNRVLLTGRSVTYLSNKYWRDATLAASLLRGKANCLSTSTLYVLIGKALNLPIRMVIIPRHAFVRWDDGETRINIETTHKGVEIPDQGYLKQAQATDDDIKVLGWFSSLGDDGFLAELLQIAARHRVGQNRLKDAIQLMEQAERLVPGRSDLKLQRFQVIADLDGRREEANQMIIHMVKTEPLPPSVHVMALMYLAGDAGGRKEYDRERKFLMAAFRVAPKSSQAGVLQGLAFCHRSMKDFRGAVRYMELAAALEDKKSPIYAGILYNLAILQKNDNRLDDALRSIREARVLNPEKWNLQVIEAGYMVLNGQMEKGKALFATVKRPRGDLHFYESMQAWFFAVSKQRDKFFKQFQHTLEIANSTHTLEWIAQDVDLDVYRNEAEFKALVKKHAKRILEGSKKGTD